MKSAILKKSLAVYVLLSAFVLAITTFAGGRLTLDTVISNQADSFYRGAEELSEHALLADDAALPDHFALLSAALEVDLRYIGADGRIYVMALRDDSAASDTLTSIEGFDFASFGPGYYEIGDFFGLYPATPHLTVLFPVTSEFTTAGYLALSRPVTELYKIRDSVLAIFLKMTAANLLISFTVLFLLSLGITHPLSRIIGGAKEFASGNFSHRIDVRSRDELGYLADSLNYMGGEIRKSRDYQGQFIANVSHDFRSPLTSIKGFTEAMLDGTIPPEMQEKYLHVIADETERLEKLTSGILALSTYENQTAELSLSVFDINEVLKNTAVVFEMLCRRKKIRIRLILSGQQLPVRADKEKIEQVIYNLLDNAVKFSDRSSEIRLETSEKYGKCHVSVSDDGAGIPQHELTKIWDRFYKVDASRGKDRKGTGLGLSIVREIISAHDQQITVVSTPGAGTTFTFTLELGDQ